MIQFIILFIGIFALFSKKISVTKKTELRRPKIYFFGIITIVITLIALVAGAQEGIVRDIFFWLGIATPIVTALILKEPKIRNQ